MALSYLSQLLKASYSSSSDNPGENNTRKDEDWEDWCNINGDGLAASQRVTAATQFTLVEDYNPHSTDNDNSGWESVETVAVQSLGRQEASSTDIGSDKVVEEKGSEGVEEEVPLVEQGNQSKTEEVDEGNANPWLNPKDMERFRHRLKVLSRDHR